MRAFLACPVSRFVKPFASVTREVRKFSSGSVREACQDKMSLPFLAALAAAALTPRHSGAIAQRHGSPIREAPLHRGAFVPEFDNDSTLLKMSEKACLLQHSTGADTDDGLGPLWAIDTPDKPSWTSLSSFNPSMDLDEQLSPHATRQLLPLMVQGCSTTDFDPDSLPLHDTDHSEYQPFGPPFCSLDPYMLLQREPSHSTLTSEHKQLMDPSCTCKVNQLTSTATGLTTDPEMILGPCNSQDDPKLIQEFFPKEWHNSELADSKALAVFRSGLITDPQLILGPCTPQDDPMLIPKFSWLDNSALIIDGEYLNALREGMIVFVRPSGEPVVRGR